MGDLIDRQAAIEVIDAVFPVDPMKSEYTQGIACGAALAKTYVEQLPSARLEKVDTPTVDTPTCEDAVSRQAVYNVLDKMPVRGFKKDGETIHGLISLSQVNSAIIDLPSAQPELLDEWCTDCKEYDHERHCCPRWNKVIRETVEEYKAEPQWNNHTVACLLADLYGDPCACNYNNISEWLPEKCEVIDSCPNPVGVACWEQFLKHRAERRTDEQDSE